MLLGQVIRTIKRKAHRGDPTIVTDQITTDMVECVNEALRELVRMLPKRFFFKQAPIAVTVGTPGTPQVLQLPADCQEPIIFHYTDAQNSFHKLYKVSSEEEWFRVWNPTASASAPDFFREIGPDPTGLKQIEVYPVSDSNLTLNMEYYRVKSPDLTVADLANPIPDIPDYLQDVVEKGALYLFLKGFDDSMMAVAKSDYEEAKLAFENADELDKDANLTFRFDVTAPSPYNSVRFTV